MCLHITINNAVSSIETIVSKVANLAVFLVNRNFQYYLDIHHLWYTQSQYLSSHAWFSYLFPSILYKSPYCIVSSNYLTTFRAESCDIYKPWLWLTVRLASERCQWFRLSCSQLTQFYGLQCVYRVTKMCTGGMLA